ncbi:hypothetical protein MNBD_GAMMA22-1158 [hydrothermal vent metagenome]|uniref:Uncharacterized protein n=1 Tax=hydrothermal vent metagenome TaxID=652676 RepID=A0A3B1B505_9ZZZZ
MRKIIIILLSLVSTTSVASNKLTIESWPEKQVCDCVSVRAYGYVVSLKNMIDNPIKDIVMFPNLGLHVILKHKDFSFVVALKSSLPFMKEKLKVSSWSEYHELLANKSNNKTIEQLRRTLEITEAKGYYKYENKKYTAFFVDLPNAPLGTLSEIMVIPNGKSKILKISGKFTKEDVKIILGNLSRL